ncbi:unnamed protein product [Mytilus coruscus]|uniref:Uncharacterized protein n=1 Tax=Mytilus coruscus TaxID=42192 RepID=A0A6J8E2M4_MYTCO|nr:unnamed protein product [Mytilus coruscus]
MLIFLTGWGLPLHIAIDSFQHEMVRLLLDSGSDPRIQTKWNQTALHIATENRFQGKNTEEIIELLLENGANVNLQDEMNRTALHGAVWNVNIVKLLLDHGANVNLQDKCSRTALHIATANGIGNNTEEITGLLLAHGAKVNLQDETNRTALHGAVWNVNIVKLLLNHGVSVNLQDKSYRTALHITTAKRKRKRNIWDFTDSFLELGAYDDFQDEIDRIALHDAGKTSERHNLDITELLLEHGANVNLLDKKVFRNMESNRDIHINNKIVLCDMFMAAGYPITKYEEPRDKTQADQKLFEHIQNRKFETLSLSSFSRICIRNTLITASDGCAITSKITQLDLPKQLHVYIERLQL